MQIYTTTCLLVVTPLLIMLIGASNSVARVTTIPSKSTWQYDVISLNKDPYLIHTAWSGNTSGTGNLLKVLRDRGEAITTNFMAKASQQQVVSFTLVNAQNEQDIQPIVDGDVINLASLPTKRLNIRADTSPASVGSVKFELSGAQNKTYADNAAPYALHGDDGKGNYYYGNWNPPAAGAYTLKATPYSGTKGTGTAGIPLTISFFISENGEPPIDQTPPYILNINRHSPVATNTNATSVTFRAFFSEKVIGVDESDFVITVTEGSLSANIDSLTVVGSNGATYDINISSITGEGVMRLDLKDNDTGIEDEVGNVISGGYTNGQTYTIEPAKQKEGFVSTTALTPLPTHTTTEDKPQSKVWTYDGKWWAVFPSPSAGTHLWRLDGNTWTRVLSISGSSNTKADCKVVGNVTHILLYRGSNLPSELVSVEYAPSLNTYNLWSQRSSIVYLQLDPGVETATIDIDSNGRMWLASDGVNNVNIRWSDAPYSSWSSPIEIASGISEDDICAVIALPANNSIGVLWSNQNSQRFGFKTHKDRANPNDWSEDEVPASHSALNVGGGMADDHLNMATSSNGTLYCAVKTKYGSKYPKIALLIRRPGGSWDDLYEIAQTEGTTPIVLLNEAIGKLRVVYSPSDNGGDLVYKESDILTINFSPRIILMNGTYHFPTSTKQNHSSEVAILAWDKALRQVVGVLGMDDLSSTDFPDPKPSHSSVVNELEEASLKEFYIYPNPFTSKTKINFTTQKDCEYSLVLYNAKGSLIDIIKQGKALAGKSVMVDLDGSSLPNGLYFIRLLSPYKSGSIKILLHK